MPSVRLRNSSKKELKALEEEALDSDGWFTSLEEYLDFLLSDWNPEGQNLNRDELEINTEYYIYAYGIDVKGEITTPLVRRLVKTNDLKEINFNLTVEDEGQTTATLKGNPDEKFTYYYLGYTSKTEYEDSFKGDDQQVIDNALGSIRMGIGNDGSKLPDVASVRMGEGSLEVEGLLPDTEYYALAFGIDNSVSACTKLTKTPFKTDAVAITDDCKFEVSVLDVNSILMNIAVKPSKATTRYFATVKATDEVKNMTPAQVADAEIAFQNGFTPPVDWSTDPRVFTGDQTLHSRRNLGVTIIKPETDYTVYVFGVSAEGVRTTEVATATTRTTAVVPLVDDARGQGREARIGDRSQRFLRRKALLFPVRSETFDRYGVLLYGYRQEEHLRNLCRRRGLHEGCGRAGRRTDHDELLHGREQRRTGLDTHAVQGFGRVFGYGHRRR